MQQINALFRKEPFIVGVSCGLFFLILAAENSTACGSDSDAVAELTRELSDFAVVSTSIQDRKEVSVQIHRDPEAALRALARLSPRAVASVQRLLLQVPCKNEASLMTIAELPSLEELDICESGWNPVISKAILRQDRLVSLRAERSGLVGADLRDIAKLSHLQFLMIGNNPIGGPDLACLATCEKLTQLSLAGLNVRTKDVTFIARLKELCWLDLPDTKVDNQIIDLVRGCREIQILTLTGTAVNDEGAANLLSVLPKAIISYGQNGILAEAK
jgi:hypothetical protein